MKKKIALSDFETMTRNRGMTPAVRTKVDQFDVFIADGYSDKEKKFITWWAVGTPERMDLAQILEFDKYEEREGIKVPSDRDSRVKATMEHVKNIIPNIKRTPIYDSKV